MMHRYYLLLFLLLLLMSCGFHAGTEIGNPATVSGTLYLEDGTTAPEGDSLFLFPKDYNPYQAEKQKTATTTIANGRFTFTKVEEGEYSLYGKSSRGTLAYKRSVIVSESQRFEVTLDDTLYPAETLTVSVSDSDSEVIADGVLYVVGSDIEKSIVAGYNQLFVPVGTIGLCYIRKSSGEKLDVGFVSDTIVIKPDEKIEIKKHPIPQPFTLKGDNPAVPNTEYVYTVSPVTSSLGHPIEYRLGHVKYTGQTDWWAEATFEAWQDSTSFPFTFPDTGRYKMRVQARSIYHTGSVSEWSDYLEVTVE